ncbi:hypothetical protein [Peribacillus glennii]|nr:hypothetical protein [Peribacillus glennii]
MMVSIEQHVEWVANCIGYLRRHHVETIEAKVEAEEYWSQHCNDLADAVLITKTDSWYMGGISKASHVVSWHIPGVLSHTARFAMMLQLKAMKDIL